MRHCWGGGALMSTCEERGEDREQSGRSHLLSRGADCSVTRDRNQGPVTQNVITGLEALVGTSYCGDGSTPLRQCLEELTAQGCL